MILSSDGWICLTCQPQWQVNKSCDLCKGPQCRLLLVSLGHLTRSPISILSKGSRLPFVSKRVSMFTSSMGGWNWTILLLMNNKKKHLQGELREKQSDKLVFSQRLMSATLSWCACLKCISSIHLSLAVHRLVFSFLIK